MVGVGVGVGVDVGAVVGVGVGVDTVEYVTFRWGRFSAVPCTAM
jgi:hypothetical protein